MARSLRDIPGSSRGRRRFLRRRERDLWAPPRSSNLDLTPPALRLERNRNQTYKPRRRLDLTVLLIAVAAAGFAVWMGTSFWRATRVHVSVAGFTDGAPLQPAAAAELGIRIIVPDSDDRFRSELTLDGVALLDDLEFDGDTLVVVPADLVALELVPGALDEGPHELVLDVARPFLPDSQFRWTYGVDSQAPALELPASFEPVPIEQAVTVAGRTEAGAEVRLGGEPVEVGDDGRFAVRFDHAPTGVLHVEAVDAAGNTTAADTVVPVAYPDASRAVHVSAAGWADATVRATILGLVDQRLVDAVQLDLKDESGVVGYDSQLATAKAIGAVRPRYELAAAVATIEEHGARVIGRIVAFRDPIYAAAAWAGGRHDEVLQSPDGAVLGDGSYTSYVHPAVRAYNLELAEEAAEQGVTDILWDYVRRPEGNPSSMLVPGLTGASSEAVATFLDEAHAALRAKGAYQGATVLGIAVRSGDSIGQDVPRFARAVDYLAPMAYPAQFSTGQYDVADPLHQPSEIVARALADFQQAIAGSGARLLPWIQDFSTRAAPYGPLEVRAQLDAATSLGLTGFLLWNPQAAYHPDALTPIP